MTTDTVRGDFDRIARLSEQGGAAAYEYADWLLGQLPAECGAALEIGCGMGDFTRALAPRCASVLALDLSPEMIRIARERSAALPHVDFRVADAESWLYPAEAFGCIVSLATLHHLDAGRLLPALRAALRPGGTLLVHDVVDRPGLRHLPVNVIAALQRVAARRPRPSRELRRAWREHGRGDRYLRPGEVRPLFAPLFPGITVRHHLGWRYTVVWRKPAG